MIRSAKLTTKHFGKNKLVLGFVGVAVSAVLGTAGVAAAHPAMGTPGPTSKAACANWRAFKMFSNRGQCVSWFEHHMPGHGHGYGYGGGNGNTVSTGVNVNVNGDNNVITVVINYFFG